MRHSRLKWAAILGCAAAALLTAGASAALVEVENIVLRADGGFQPRYLPRRQFAPIDFRGSVEIGAKSGGQPEALEQAVIDFDRDGRLSAGGLPTCAAEEVASDSPAQARAACPGAIVGSGRIQAQIALPTGSITASSPLTIFNGPPEAGHPTVVLHAQITAPATQTFAIVVPIERRQGEFRYRATLNLPTIAGGLGAITEVKVKVGRRFSAGGRRRSYVSAHCSDGVLRTHGRFIFAGGTIVDGDVEKFCRAR
ncbi:MAG TPA: hypothetical protein VHU86_06585 [Solirubrobacterales bacterium]|jgi:hypothetical protein|nr:hypothetical protein [Solirubrobacterales bacterium]